MKQSTLPNHAELAKALSKTSQKLNASQAHGLISGILCGKSTSDASWEELIIGGKATKATRELIKSLYANTEQELKTFSFEFYLVLPEDNVPLPERAEALTLWCQGFLTGLKLAQIEIVGREPGEVTDAINDIIEIAKMQYEEVVESEEDEMAYTELAEFVRMAVTMIYQTTRESSEKDVPSPRASDHLH